MLRNLKITASTLMGCWLLLAATAASAAMTAADLKQQERRVKQVVATALPCTVCVQSSGGEGSGSGVVVSEDGLVLTAGHVTAATGAKLTIIFPDGRKVQAKTLGANRARDAGMAQIIEEGKYPYVALGASGRMKANDLCVALGHAGGFDVKRTPPVRLGRVITNQHFIVTDCTLIGGDSGGPLFDSDGRLIGIHSNIGATLAQNQHVPIDVFLRDWDRMKNGETWGSFAGRPNSDPKRPVLGVRLSPQPHASGVLLHGVMPKSPAAIAGVKVGDVILEVDGHVVKAPADVMELVQKKKVGQQVDIKLQRDTEVLEFNIQLVPAVDILPKAVPEEDSTDDPPETDDEKLDAEQPDDQKLDDGADRTDEDSDAQDAGDAGANPEAEDSGSGRSIQELLKEASEQGGRLELTRDEMRRLQRHLAEKMGRSNFLLPVTDDEDIWFRQLIAAYKPIVATAATSTYRILAEDQQIALATAIAPDTLVTKASEIDGQPFQIEATSDLLLPGKLVRTFPAYDLAVVRVEKKILTPAKLHVENNDLPLGSFVAAVGESSQPAAIGVISVKPRNLKSALRGYLGILMQGAKGVIMVRQVQPKSPAHKAGLKPGDVIVKLDDVAYPTPRELAQAIGGHQPGDQVVFQIVRDDEELSVKVELSDRDAVAAWPQSRLEMMNRLGGDLSDTRSGFPLALQHDCPLAPTDCGGPLVNLDGQIVGINIARAGRIKSYAIPADIVEHLLAKVGEEVEPAPLKKPVGSAATE